MPSNILKALEKGLQKLKNDLEARKRKIQEKLSRKEKLTSDDEAWMDGEGNTVDEDRVVDALKRAHTPERVLREMDDGDKAVVDKLRGLAGDVPKKAGEKRKHEFIACPRNSVNFHRALQEGISRRLSRSPRKPSTQTKPLMAPLSSLRNPSLEERITILDWYHKNGRKQGDTYEHFRHVPNFRNVRFSQSAISKWLEKESQIREDHEIASPQERAAKRVKQTELLEVTEMMELWVTGACNEGVHLTGDILRTKWRQFEELAGVPEEDRLKCSNGWLEAIKKRLGLRNWKRHGESGSVDPEAVERDCSWIRKLILVALKDGYSLSDIYNMDETGLLYAWVLHFLFRIL
jgi:hypothetical protein